MHIDSVEVSNFRKLLAVRIDLAEQTTLLVGANNSGKTSAMQALRHFLVDGGQFNIHDFTLSHWHAINKLGDDWVTTLTSKSASVLSAGDWEAFLPTLDVWLHVGKDEIHHVRSILPTLSWKPGLIGIRLRLELEKIDELYVDFTSSVTAASHTTQAAAAKSRKPLAVHLWPSSMMDFLDRRLRKHFTLKAYVLDPTKIRVPINGVAQPQKLTSASTAIVGNPLSGLVKIHEINAQRGFDNATGWNSPSSDPTFHEVLACVAETGLFELSEIVRDKITNRKSSAESVEESPEDEAADPQEDTDKAWELFLDTRFEQIIAYTDYVSGSATSATHQGVKGLEFPRVPVVIDDQEARGFMFSYDKLFQSKAKPESDLANERNGNETSIDRTRRLFYVTCSRAEQSLAIVAYSENPTTVRATAIREGWFDDDEIELLTM